MAFEEAYFWTSSWQAVSKVVWIGSRWGNPFRIVEHGGEYTREESVRLYREYIIQKIETVAFHSGLL